jgi:tRNA A37 threonylcarbamoyltransferase TsaD
MNENNYLEEVDLQFMFTSCISAMSKMFGTTDEVAREETFEQMARLTRQSFPDGMKVTISELLKWGTTAQELKQFFSMVDLYN